MSKRRKEPERLFRSRPPDNPATPDEVTKHLTESHYVPCVLELIKEYQSQLKPGTYHEVKIYHDDWCAIFKGQPCNCNPVCELLKPETKTP
jgi:hypothetical protein